MEDEEISPYSEKQVYEDLKNECLAKEILFIDEEFPPGNKSIVRFTDKPETVLWKRAKELAADPKFIINNGRRNADDFGQGALGDCWFIASAAAVSNIPEFFNRMVPSDQSFDDGQYCGMFHFRFWRYGGWYDVIVDDYLPVDSHNNNALIYCRNKKEENEFWVALLEKAYAKLHGCYEFLDGGSLSDAVVDMTGGIPEEMSLKDCVNKIQKGKKTDKDPEVLWNFLVKAHKSNSISGCSITGDASKGTRYGLVERHAYSITGFASVKNKNLIRLRNPWGQDGEWSGAWSDKSDEWNNVSETDKKRCGLIVDDDGEFWMPFEQFIEFFDQLKIVHVKMHLFKNKQAVNEKNSNKWSEFQFCGEWVVGENAGGSNSSSDAFWTNPQYLFKIDSIQGKPAGFIGALMQIFTREDRAYNNGESTNQAIMFYLYRVNDDVAAEIDFDSEEELPMITSDQVVRIGYSNFSSTREVTGRFSVDAGVYAVILCTQEKDQPGDFLLRLLLNMKNNLFKAVFKTIEWIFNLVRQIVLFYLNLFRHNDLKSFVNEF